MHAVLDRDGRIAFEGKPEDVENWLFENTSKYNARLRVRLDVNDIVPALKYIGAA